MIGWVALAGVVGLWIMELRTRAELRRTAPLELTSLLLVTKAERDMAQAAARDLQKETSALLQEVRREHRAHLERRYGVAPASPGPAPDEDGDPFRDVYK